jgi:hypothetical protein
LECANNDTSTGKYVKFSWDLNTNSFSGSYSYDLSFTDAEEGYIDNKTGIFTTSIKTYTVDFPNTTGAINIAVALKVSDSSADPAKSAVFAIGD